MAVIVKDRAKLKDLVDTRLDDITGDKGEVRAAAQQYYLSLVQEDMECTDHMATNESLDSNELAVIGFVAGYETCLRSHS